MFFWGGGRVGRSSWPGGGLVVSQACFLGQVLNQHRLNTGLTDEVRAQPRVAMVHEI